MAKNEKRRGATGAYKGTKSGNVDGNFALSLYSSPEAAQRQTLRARLAELDEVLQTCQNDDCWIDAYTEWLDVHRKLYGGE